MPALAKAGIVLLAALAASSADAAQSSIPGMDPTLAIERMMTCRTTPLTLDEGRRHLLAQGWPDVTRTPMVGEARSYQFQRDRVWLVIAPFNASVAECAVHATLPEGSDWADILGRLTAAVGRAPDSSTANTARWDNIGDRRIEASLMDRRWFNVFFRPLNAEPTPDPHALTAASTAPAAAADEIATAAAACIAALEGRRLDRAVLRDAGWGEASERGGTRVLSRSGSNVRIFTGDNRQCVVDAYGERRDSFDAIRDAIRARLAERFGAEAQMGQALGRASSPSRGQGFTVGNRIGVLSSEQRDDGLSIRFTVMSMR